MYKKVIYLISLFNNINYINYFWVSIDRILAKYGTILAEFNFININKLTI